MKQIDWRNLLKRHEEMVLDDLRTRPLVEAVKAGARNKIVADIGTGLGLLSFAAARAGAKKVYAIEVDGESLDAARFFAKRLGFAGRIEFISGVSFEVELREKVDLIVCETVGSLAFDENIAFTIADAKKRFLKKGGRIIPESLELWGAPVFDTAAKHDWSDVASFDLSPPAGSELFLKRSISKKDLAADPEKIACVNFMKGSNPEVRGCARFKIKKAGTLAGLALWPRVSWDEKNETDASLFKSPTHWKQGIVSVDHKIVKPGKFVDAEIIFSPHPHSQHYMTDVRWRMG